jgi:polysaccharide export outer membrane protein
MNLRYYVLGEVKSPGAKSFARDKLTITEALAQSGDLSLYGIRNKIYVIRQEGNKKVTYQMNMLSAEELLKSPAYYIQQNDVIYVDANNTRKRQSNASGNQFQSASLWMSMASVLTTLAVLIFK